MFKRIVVAVLGLFIMALGVAISVKADLGVSPISCIPYVYSLKFNLTMGEFMIAMNSLLLLAQVALLRRKCGYLQLSQLASTFASGFFIDFSLYLVSGINAPSYAWKVILCLLSCMIIAFGVFLLVKANVTYLPGDGLVATISDLFHTDFGKTKISLDSSMVIFGTVSSFVFLHGLQGIREGTIAAALLVGAIVKLYNSKLGFFDRWLNNKAAGVREDDMAADGQGDFPVITISREYGSGGHEIGQRIAKELGIAFYDKELVNITAKKSGFTEEYIQQNEQKLADSLLDELYRQNYAYMSDKLPPSDVLFLVQSKIIRELSAKGPCVIVGRCANFILKDRKGCCNIFIHASKKYRESKIINDYGVASAISDEEIAKLDRERAHYCSRYTGQDWRDATNYHISIDSSAPYSEQLIQNIIGILKTTISQAHQ